MDLVDPINAKKEEMNIHDYVHFVEREKLRRFMWSTSKFGQ